MLNEGIVEVENALRSTLLSFLAVFAFDLVRCPRTGKPIACRRPLYDPTVL
jgi:hypothetical protein